MPLFGKRSTSKTFVQTLRDTLEEGRGYASIDPTKARVTLRKILRMIEDASKQEKQSINENKDEVINILWEAGKLLFDLNDKEKAFDFFEKIKELNPNDFKPWFEIGKTLLTLNIQIPYATVNLKKALELNPDNIETYVLLGDVYRIQKDLDTAKKYYKEALKKDPQRADIAEKILSIDPNDVEVLNLLLEYYTKINDKQKAAEVYAHLASVENNFEYINKALELSPDNISILKTKIRLLIENKNFSEAKNTLDKLIEIAPSDSEIYILKELISNRSSENKLFEEIKPESAEINKGNLFEEISPSESNIKGIENIMPEEIIKQEKVESENKEEKQKEEISIENQEKPELNQEVKVEQPQKIEEEIKNEGITKTEEIKQEEQKVEEEKIFEEIKPSETLPQSNENVKSETEEIKVKEEKEPLKVEEIKELPKPEEQKPQLEEIKQETNIIENKQEPTKVEEKKVVEIKKAEQIPEEQKTEIQNVQPMQQTAKPEEQKVQVTKAQPQVKIQIRPPNEKEIQALLKNPKLGEISIKFRENSEFLNNLNKVLLNNMQNKQIFIPALESLLKSGFTTNELKEIYEKLGNVMDAISLFVNSKYNDAEKILNGIVAKDFKNSIAWFYKTRIALKMNNLMAAKNFWLMANKFDNFNDLKNIYPELASL